MACHDFLENFKHYKFTIIKQINNYIKIIVTFYIIINEKRLNFMVFV